MFEAYKAAQPQVAKLYAVKKMLTPGTDALDTGALASQLNNGAPLTGNLDTIARAANLYGTGSKSTPMWQRALPYVGIGSGVGVPHAAAALGLSMAAKRAMLNDPQSLVSRLAGGVTQYANRLVPPELFGAGGEAFGDLARNAPVPLANGLFAQ